MSTVGDGARRCRGIGVLIVALTSACSPVSGDPAPDPPPAPIREWSPIGPVGSAFSGTFLLSLEREYGFAVFRECRLTVTPRMASLLCTSGAAQRPAVNVETALQEEAGSRLRQLATAADLYGGKVVGRDSTASDGIYETLRVTNSQGETAVLVTSGNRSFKEGARKELLDELRKIEQGLRERARPPQRK